MSEDDVEITNLHVGNDTQVKFKVKTLIWIVAGIVSLISTFATLGYFNMKSQIESQKSDFDKGKIEYKEEIKLILKSDLKEERDKREQLQKDISDIRADVKVILDRTGPTRTITHETVSAPTEIPLPNNR